MAFEAQLLCYGIARKRTSPKVIIKLQPQSQFRSQVSDLAICHTTARAICSDLQP